MNVYELQETLAYNMKRYRKGRFTQESLAETINVSPQEINGNEGKRRFPRVDILVKIAAALEVEVYQLFITKDSTPIIVEDTPENEKIRAKIREEVIAKVRASVSRTLDRIAD